MKEKARQGYRLHLLIIVMIAAAIIGGFFSLFLQNLAVRYHWTLPLPELQAEDAGRNGNRRGNPGNGRWGQHCCNTDPPFGGGDQSHRHRP